MISLLQVLLKNGLVPAAVFNKFVEIAREYGLDNLNIPYKDLKDIFEDPKGYLYNKYGLKKLLPKEVSDEFSLLFPKPVPKINPKKFEELRNQQEKLVEANKKLNEALDKLKEELKAKVDELKEAKKEVKAKPKVVKKQG